MAQPMESMRTADWENAEFETHHDQDLGVAPSHQTGTRPPSSVAYRARAAHERKKTKYQDLA